MYYNLRKNFMPIMAGICIIFAVATVQGAYEYKKAVNTKKALKFSQDYDSNVEATSKFNVANINYDLDQKYIPRNERNIEYEKNVINNWNYSGYKKVKK